MTAGRSLGRKRSWDIGPFNKHNPGEQQMKEPSITIHNHLPMHRMRSRDAEHPVAAEYPMAGEGPEDIVVHNHIPSEHETVAEHEAEDEGEEQCSSPYPANSAEDKAFRRGFARGRRRMTHGDDDPEGHEFLDEPGTGQMSNQPEDDPHHMLAHDHQPIVSLAQLNDHNRRKRNRPTRDRLTPQPPRTLKQMNEFLRKWYK
jgi:hypothetical protein